MCIALTSEDAEQDDKMILMNKVVRRNLRVRMGDIVSVHACPDEVPNATRIHVLPFADSIEGISGNITETYLVKYFRDMYRPVKKNDTFIVRENFRPVEFKVVDVDPPEYGIVAPTTTLFDEGEPINRDDEEEILIAMRLDKSARLFCRAVRMRKFCSDTMLLHRLRIVNFAGEQAHLLIG